MELNPSKYVLLTGAGFTKDFGGFLANEMHEKLLNHPNLRDTKRIRKLLLDDFDYESVYSKVMDTNYTDEEKEALSNAMFDVYTMMDDTTKDYCHNDHESRGIGWPGVHAGILSVCTRESGKKGYHFTTNQDIFLERHTGRRSGYVERIGGNQIGLGPRARLERSHYVQLPTEEQIEQRERQFDSSGDLQYIKLHGSLGWLSAKGGSTMVFGKAKLEDIEDEPVLKTYYHTIFKGVLSQGNCHLIVVGYSFGDDHINNVVVEAAQNHGLGLYIFTPSGPEVLKKRLNSVNPVLWQSLGGYFTGRIKELFPFGADHRNITEYIYRILGVRN